MNKALKQPIRAFMQAHYTDERLAQLLCHTRDGRLSFYSCCCFIGIPTATHGLRGMGLGLECLEGDTNPLAGTGMAHSVFSRQTLTGAVAAEDAFVELANGVYGIESRDEKRRRILIPMIRAEMKRREKVRSTLSLPMAIAQNEHEHDSVCPQKI